MSKAKSGGGVTMNKNVRAPVRAGAPSANKISPAGAAGIGISKGNHSDTGAVLGPHEFEVDHATCRGDSGGPALDARTGEIVGVVSRGGSCSADGNHVYTRVDSYVRLATVAFGSAARSARESVAENR